MGKAKDFWYRNGANILTGVGVVGVGVTAVLAGKASIFAMEIIDEYEEEKNEDLSFLDKMVLTLPVYIPTIFAGVCTAGCIIGANHINNQQKASLIAAHTCLGTLFAEYRRKVKEVYGEDGEQKIKDELVKEVELYNKYGSLHETRLFYDKISKRYFEMSMYEMKEAEYNINRMFNFLGCLNLNELYEFVGLQPTELGETIGWSAFKDWECLGFSWIEITFEEVETPDGLQALELRYNIDPAPDYYEWVDPMEDWPRENYMVLYEKE